MNIKQLSLINYLIQQHDWLSTKIIANDLGFSTRSIRNYIAEINLIHTGLIYSSNKGYKINHKVYQSIIKDNPTNNTNIPETQCERVLYIIRKLLTSLTKKEKITTYELEDELYISSTTLINDLRKVNTKLSRHDLLLSKDKNYLYVTGSEKNKRKVIIDLIHSETKKKFLSLDNLQEILPNYDIQYIHQIIMDTLNKYHYFCNDYALFSLTLHTIISIDRLKYGYSSNSPIAIEETTEYNIAKEITSILKDKYFVQYPDQEIYELSLLLRSRISKYEYKDIKFNSLLSEIGDDTFSLTKNLIKEVNDTYFIDLSDDNLIVKFALHMSNLLLRASNDYLNRNPLSISIQNQYPLIYEIALYIANRLQELKKIKINEGEIAYIALHIGGILEEKRMMENRISGLIYSPQYYDQNSIIFNKINQTIPNLITKDIITDEALINQFTDVELIISTVEVNNKKINIPSIIISPFISNNDLTKINNIVSQLILEKKQNKLKSNLEEFIDEELFFINDKYETKDETIKFMTDIYNKLGYTDNDYYDDVLKREKLNSTAFGNIAIPHALVMNAKKTGIFIFVSKKLIQWDAKKVNLIIMLAINKNDSNHFKDIYENLTLFLSDICNIEKTINCTSYKEFITTLVSFTSLS